MWMMPSHGKFYGGDEAHFLLNKIFNTQSSRVWASEPSNVMQERFSLSPKFTVSCGVASLQVSFLMLILFIRVMTIQDL